MAWSHTDELACGTSVDIECWHTNIAFSAVVMSLTRDDTDTVFSSGYEYAMHII